MLSFDPSVAPHAVSAVVKELDFDGNARLAFSVSHDGLLESFEEIVPISLLIKEVPAKQGLKTQDIVCFKQASPWGQESASARIDHIFSNGAVEIHSRGIFMRGLLFYQKKAIVNINTLQACGLKTNGSSQ